MWFNLIVAIGAAAAIGLDWIECVVQFNSGDWSGSGDWIGCVWFDLIVAAIGFVLFDLIVAAFCGEGAENK